LYIEIHGHSETADARLDVSELPDQKFQKQAGYYCFYQWQRKQYPCFSGQE